jgi:hypothetical protein
MANVPQNINLVVLYDLHIYMQLGIYLPVEKIYNQPHVNVLDDDTALYDSFTDKHKAVALMAILSRHHLDKLTDKNILKIARNFLKKISEGVEKTGIIADVTNGRPVFRHRTCAEYLAARWL